MWLVGLLLVVCFDGVLIGVDSGGFIVVCLNWLLG